MVAEPARVAEVQAVCAKWELDATADRAGHRRRDLPGQAPRARWSRRFPGQRLVDDCPIYHPEAERGDEAGRLAEPPDRPAEPAVDLEARAASCCSTRPTSRASAGSTSSTTRPCRPRPCSAPGGDAGVIRVPGTSFGLAVTRRLQRPAGRARPLRGRQGRRGRGGPQRRLHRSPAAGHHRLPQLRQPRKARGLLPVPRGVPRDRRRLPRVRHSGDRRQRLASTTRAPPARSIRRPPSAWSACSSDVDDRVPSHFAAPGDEIFILGATRGELGGSAYWAEVLRLCRRAIRRRSISTPSAGCSGCWWPRPSGGCSARRTTAPRAAWRWRWRKRRSAAPTRRRASGAGRGPRPATPRSVPAGWSPVRRGRRPGGRFVRPGYCRGRSSRWRIEHGVPVFRAGRVESAGGRWNSGWGPSCSLGAPKHLRRIYFEAIPRRMQHADVDRSAGE